MALLIWLHCAGQQKDGLPQGMGRLIHAFAAYGAMENPAETRGGRAPRSCSGAAVCAAVCKISMTRKPIPLDEHGFHCPVICRCPTQTSLPALYFRASIPHRRRDVNPPARPERTLPRRRRQLPVLLPVLRLHPPQGEQLLHRHKLVPPGHELIHHRQGGVHAGGVDVVEQDDAAVLHPV